jgi:hypothetical protein
MVKPFPQHFRYRDPLDLPLCGPAEVVIPDTPRVHIEPPAQLRFFPRAAPRFLDDPDEVGLFEGFEEENLAMPPRFIVSAAGVRVTGFRTVLCPQGYFFLDDAVWGRHRQPFLDALRAEPGFEESALFPAPDDPAAFAWNPAGRPEQHLEGTVVLLSSTEPSNYGSFLFRILPKLANLTRYGIKSPRYLVWTGHRSFVDFLALTRPDFPAGQIVEFDPQHVYHAEHLVMPSLRNNTAYLDPESLALYERLRQRHGTVRQPGKRIYVSRLGCRGESARVMENEQELVAQLEMRGFTIVAPETLSAAEQIQVFSSAEMVVGPSGSGMFNVVFCHPGTRLVAIESEPHWIHSHMALFASCKMDYGIFVGNAHDRSYAVHHQPWTINIDALLWRLLNFPGA